MRSNSRTYPDHQNCAHAWAHQLSEAGHASNFFFTGPTIYSYGSHFPIATLDGDRVFFTTEGYSKSTGKHKSRVRSAISHLKIIYVKYVPLTLDPASEESFIRKNMEDWITEIQQLLSTFERHPRRRSIQQEIDAITSRLKTFVSELEVTPDARLQEVLIHPTLAAIADLNKERAKKEAEVQKKRLALLSKLFDVTLNAWRNYTVNQGSLSNPEDPNLAYLRWNEMTRCVQTSKGIDVPVNIARKCFDFVQNQLPAGCSSCNFSLLGFQVKSITPEFLTVGCHKIPMEEIVSIARGLGWTTKCP